MIKFNLIFPLTFVATAMFLISCEEAEPELLTLSDIVTGQEPPGEDCKIDHRTQTPGGWGSPASGNNTGSLVDMYFDVVFPEYLHIGCFSTEGKCLFLTSADAVEEFLPNGGKPAVLVDTEITDPTGKDVKNSLAGHIVALTLSIYFDHYLPDFGGADYLLCDLVVCSGVFKGESVSRVLQVANDVIGGCSTAYTIDQIYTVISNINENFVDGEVDNGFLCCPGEVKEQI